MKYKPELTIYTGYQKFDRLADGKPSISGKFTPKIGYSAPDGKFDAGLEFSLEKEKLSQIKTTKRYIRNEIPSLLKKIVKNASEISDIENEDKRYFYYKGTCLHRISYHEAFESMDWKFLPEICLFLIETPQISGTVDWIILSGSIENYYTHETARVPRDRSGSATYELFEKLVSIAYSANLPSATSNIGEAQVASWILNFGDEEYKKRYEIIFEKQGDKYVANEKIISTYFSSPDKKPPIIRNIYYGSPLLVQSFPLKSKIRY